MLRSRTIGLAGACLGLALAGCGADVPPPRTPPSAAVQPAEAITAANNPLTVNRRTERSFERAAGYCAAKLAGREPSPSAARIRNQVQDLVVLERTDPETELALSGGSLSAAITRVASTLRPCDPTLADELDLAAAALPEA